MKHFWLRPTFFHPQSYKPGSRCPETQRESDHRNRWKSLCFHARLQSPQGTAACGKVFTRRILQLTGNPQNRWKMKHFWLRPTFFHPQSYKPGSRCPETQRESDHRNRWKSFCFHARLQSPQGTAACGKVFTRSILQLTGKPMENEAFLAPPNSFPPAAPQARIPVS